jgi:hypothetical protein
MSGLPPFLHNTEPLEPEEQGLQLALVTTQLASIEARLGAVSMLAEAVALLLDQPDMGRPEIARILRTAAGYLATPTGLDTE